MSLNGALAKYNIFVVKSQTNAVACFKRLETLFCHE